MKVINKMMAIILLSGTGIGSVQAQDTTLFIFVAAPISEL